MAIKRTQLSGCLALSFLILFVPGCGKKTDGPAAGNADESAPMVSALRVNDPRAQRQLLSGFYNIENGAWRWTAGKFSVALQAPPGAETKGAKLALKLNIPGSVMKLLNGMTLSAKVGDTSLPPQSFNKSGDYTYEADLPSTVLQSSPVRVDFWLNKTIPPSSGDHRELGVIVSQIGLTSK